jgi:tetratricopeptide (TPR) repeat protein
MSIRVQRSPVAPGSFEEKWLEGQLLYADGDYVGAETLLQQAVELDPRHGAAWLYLGSARLLQGRATPAMAALSRTQALAEDPLEREECLWQLANGHLLEGKRADASRLLREVIETDGKRRVQAEELLQALRALHAGADGSPAD